ncbi:MAG: ankyrin repeat domain-containing protein [Parashewanella sp.]
MATCAVERQTAVNITINASKITSKQLTQITDPNTQKFLVTFEHQTDSSKNQSYKLTVIHNVYPPSLYALRYFHTEAKENQEVSEAPQWVINAREAIEYKLTQSKDLVTQAERANREGVSQIVQDGANINHQDKHGNTALYYLARTRNQDDSLLGVLLEQGANPFLPNNEGWSAFHHMCATGKVTVIELIIREAKNPSTDFAFNQQQLLTAFDAKAQLSKSTPCTPLMLTAKKGFGELAYRLIEAGVSLKGFKKVEDISTLAPWLERSSFKKEITRFPIKRSAFGVEKGAISFRALTNSDEDSASAVDDDKSTGISPYIRKSEDKSEGKSAYFGKRNFRYSDEESEGNRFIDNKEI